MRAVWYERQGPAAMTSGAMVSRGVRLLARVFFVDERAVTTLQVPGVGVDALTDRVAEDLRHVGPAGPGRPADRPADVPRRSWRVAVPGFTVAVVEVRPRSGGRPGSELTVRSRLRPLVAGLVAGVLAVAAVVALVAVARAVAEPDPGRLWGARYLLVAVAVGAALRGMGDARARALAARLARP